MTTYTTENLLKAYGYTQVGNAWHGDVFRIEAERMDGGLRYNLCLMQDSWSAHPVTLVHGIPARAADSALVGLIGCSDFAGVQVVELLFGPEHLRGIRLTATLDLGWTCTTAPFHMTFERGGVTGSLGLRRRRIPLEASGFGKPGPRYYRNGLEFINAELKP